MTEQEVVSLANEAGQAIPFYQWFYEGKLPFATIEEIPVVKKEDTCRYEAAHPEIENYYGENLAAEEKDDGKNFVLESSINKRQAVYSKDDMMVIVSYLFQNPIVADLQDNLTIVLNSSYHAKTWLSKLEAVMEGVKFVVLDAQTANAPCTVRDALASHRAESRKILFTGTDNWMRDLLMRSEGGCLEGDIPIMSIFPEDILLYLPKQFNPFSDSVLSEAVNEQIIVFSSVETGMKGLFRVGLCDAMADSDTPIYHLYREDIYEEVVNEMNCITWNKKFPHVRWLIGDYVELLEINCACGYSGKGMVFKYREDDPEGILHHQNSDRY
jgi:hypothetical protein